MTTYAKAKYDYAAQNNDELEFPKGAVIHIIDKNNPNWWQGVYENREGWLPSRYVKLAKTKGKTSTEKNFSIKRETSVRTATTHKGKIIEGLIKSVKELIDQLNNLNDRLHQIDSKNAVIIEVIDLIDTVTSFHLISNANLSSMENFPGRYLESIVDLVRETYLNKFFAVYAIMLEDIRKSTLTEFTQDLKNETIKVLASNVSKLLDIKDSFIEIKRFVDRDTEDGDVMSWKLKELQNICEECEELGRIKETCVFIASQEVKGWEGSALDQFPTDVIFMTPVNIQKENYDSEQYHLFLLDTQLIFLSSVASGNSFTRTYTYRGRMDRCLLKVSRHTATSFSLESTISDKQIVFCKSKADCDLWFTHLAPDLLKSQEKSNTLPKCSPIKQIPIPAPRNDFIFHNGVKLKKFHPRASKSDPSFKVPVKSKRNCNKEKSFYDNVDDTSEIELLEIIKNLQRESTPIVKINSEGFRKITESEYQELLSLREEVKELREFKKKFLLLAAS